MVKKNIWEDFSSMILLGTISKILPNQYGIKYVILSSQHILYDPTTNDYKKDNDYKVYTTENFYIYPDHNIFIGDDLIGASVEFTTDNLVFPFGHPSFTSFRIAKIIRVIQN